MAASNNRNEQQKQRDSSPLAVEHRVFLYWT